MKKVMLLAIMGIMILACGNAHATNQEDFEKIKKGDFDCDGHVSYSDFDILKQYFGLTFPNWEASGKKGDTNGDFLIDLQDFGMMKYNFEFDYAPPTHPVTNPEPATLSLLGLGLYGLLRLRRKTK